MDFCFREFSDQIDWSKSYVSLDKELQAIERHQAIGKKITDAFFGVFTKAGQEIALLLHIEVQAGREAGFAERMFIYHYRGFDKYKKPIVSIAILADADPSWRPTVYEELYPIKMDPFHFLNFGFLMIKLLDYRGRESELSRSSNPFAVVISAHLEALKTSKDDKNRLKSKVNIIRALCKSGFKKDYILSLVSFIDWVLILPEAFEVQCAQQLEQFEEANNMQYMTSFERIGMEKGMEKGIQKGIKKGKLEGKLQRTQELLLRILKKKFGAIPADYKKRLETAEDQILLRWVDNAIDAKNVEDVFKDK